MAPPSPEGELLDETDDGEPPSDEVRPKRRLLPVIVLIAAIVVGAPFLDGVGDRRDVVIRLDEPSQVTAIAVVLRDGQTALWGTERRFVAGSAPTQVSRTLPLPTGRYELEVSLVEAGQARTIKRHFDVADDASEVVIPIHAARP